MGHYKKNQFLLFELQYTRLQYEFLWAGIDRER